MLRPLIEVVARGEADVLVPGVKKKKTLGVFNDATGRVVVAVGSACGASRDDHGAGLPVHQVAAHMMGDGGHLHVKQVAQAVAKNRKSIARELA